MKIIIKIFIEISFGIVVLYGCVPLYFNYKLECFIYGFLLNLKQGVKCCKQKYTEISWKNEEENRNAETNEDKESQFAYLVNNTESVSLPALNVYIHS